MTRSELERLLAQLRTTLSITERLTAHTNLDPRCSFTPRCEPSHVDGAGSSAPETRHGINTLKLEISVCSPDYEIGDSKSSQYLIPKPQSKEKQTISQRTK